MPTFFAALCQKCANSPSLKLSASAIIDDAETVGADLQRANVGDIKNINNCVDPLNIRWECSPSLQLYARNVWIPPLWSCLPPWLLMMWKHFSANLQRANVKNMKNITITSIPWIYSEHAHLLCSFTPVICEFSLFEVVGLCDYWWCWDIQCWFANG